MAAKALLVGIDAYAAKPLQGCANDVADMATLLQTRLGFAAASIQTLVDGQATRAAILEALSGLLAGAARGDRLCWHFSGHGTQFPEDDGSAHDALCPFDIDWTRGSVITDQDIRALTQTLPAGIQFTMVMDCCNSGNLARFLRRPKGRFLTPPPTLRQALAKAASVAPLLDVHDQCALLAACRTDEEASEQETGGRTNGAFTRALVSVVGHPEAQANPLSSVMAQITALVEQDFSQHPQLRGLPTLATIPFLGPLG